MPPNLPGHPDVVMGGGPSLQASLATMGSLKLERAIQEQL